MNGKYLKFLLSAARFKKKNFELLKFSMRDFATVEILTMFVVMMIQILMFYFLFVWNKFRIRGKIQKIQNQGLPVVLQVIDPSKINDSVAEEKAKVSNFFEGPPVELELNKREADSKILVAAQVRIYRLRIDLVVEQKVETDEEIN